MFKLERLRTLQNDYVSWIKEMEDFLTHTQQNLLQSDAQDALQEKISSILISVVFMSVLSGAVAW